MTNPPPRAGLKSRPTPTQQHHATPATPPTSTRGRKVVGRQAVLPSVRPGPQPNTPPGDGRTPTAWLHITAPPDLRAIPSATSWCQCGRHRTATSHTDVLRLIEDHTAHRDACPLRTTESRNAA